MTENSEAFDKYVKQCEGKIDQKRLTQFVNNRTDLAKVFMLWMTHKISDTADAQKLVDRGAAYRATEVDKLIKSLSPENQNGIKATLEQLSK